MASKKARLDKVEKQLSDLDAQRNADELALKERGERDLKRLRVLSKSRETRIQAAAVNPADSLPRVERYEQAPAIDPAELLRSQVSFDARWNSDDGIADVLIVKHPDDGRTLMTYDGEKLTFGLDDMGDAQYAIKVLVEHIVGQPVTP